MAEKGKTKAKKIAELEEKIAKLKKELEKEKKERDELKNQLWKEEYEALGEKIREKLNKKEEPVIWHQEDIKAPAEHYVTEKLFVPLEIQGTNSFDPWGGHDDMTTDFSTLCIPNDRSIQIDKGLQRKIPGIKKKVEEYVQQVLIKVLPCELDEDMAYFEYETFDEHDAEGTWIAEWPLFVAYLKKEVEKEEEERETAAVAKKKKVAGKRKK